MNPTRNKLSQLFSECQQVLATADCLYTEQQVLSAIDAMASEIGRLLSASEPVVLSIMNGGLIPAGLLFTKLDFPLQIDYLHATRYREKTRGGDLLWLAKSTIPLDQRTVLLLDDIHDEGITLEKIKQHCLEQGAKKVYTAVLVNKVHNRKNNTHADIIGLEVPDRYVFGFGMDYKGLLRNAAGIYAVKGL